MQSQEDFHADGFEVLGDSVTGCVSSYIMHLRQLANIRYNDTITFITEREVKFVYEKHAKQESGY